MWRGETYAGWGYPRKPITLGAALRGGGEPGCQDTIPGTRSPDRPVALRTIKGITPSAAVARAEPPRRIFIAEGYLPQLADFPLHDAIYGSKDRPDGRTWELPPAKRRFRCDRVVRRTVTLVYGGNYDFFVDVRTVVPHRPNTLPRLKRGMRLRVALTECRRGPRFRYRVADRIDILR